MPLAETVDEDWVGSWKTAKSSLWSSPERGPWAVYFEERLAGWSGLQPDGDDEVELAIVLNVWAWRLGREIMDATIALWHQFDIDSSINIYLPSSRPVDLVARKLNLLKVGEGKFGGHTFIKLRLLEAAVNVKPLEE